MHWTLLRRASNPFDDRDALRPVIASALNIPLSPGAGAPVIKRLQRMSLWATDEPRGVRKESSMLSYYYDGITLTQGVFLCCLFVFGPAFGFLAVYRHVASRIGGFWAFLFECFSSYSGWFVSGVAAMLIFPDYGTKNGPSETVAILFTIPGFITGWIGLQILRKFADREPGRKSEQD